MQLVSVFDLGQQFLTGVFLRTLDSSVTRGPLGLVWCLETVCCSSVSATTQWKYTEKLTAIVPVSINRWSITLISLWSNDIVLDIQP
jgi:hypothetical protein